MAVVAILAIGFRRILLRILRYWPFLLLVLLLIGCVVIAVLHYQAELWLWFNGLNWMPSGSGADFMSYVPIWWEQALIAAFAASLIILLLTRVFKELRTLFWGWGFLWALLLIATLTVTLFFAGPYIMVYAKEVLGQTAEIWKQTYPTLGRLALTIVVISIGLACLVGIPTLKEFGERAFALGALILGAYIALAVIWKYDGSRHSYASAPPRTVTTTVLAPNTSVSCPGLLTSVSLDEDGSEINPNSCYMFWKVDDGRVILSGYMGTKEIGPEPSEFDARIFQEARAKADTAAMRYILCAGPKRDLSRNDCS